MRSLAPSRRALVPIMVAVLVGLGNLLSACGEDGGSSPESLAPTADGALSGLDVDLHFAEG